MSSTCPPAPHPHLLALAGRQDDGRARLRGGRDVRVYRPRQQAGPVRLVVGGAALARASLRGGACVRAGRGELQLTARAHSQLRRQNPAATRPRTAPPKVATENVLPARPPIWRFSVRP